MYIEPKPLARDLRVNEYSLYTGTQAERYRSTVYTKTIRIDTIITLQHATVSVAPTVVDRDLVRVIERIEQGSWLVDFEVLEKTDSEATLRLRQVDYTYRQRAFPTYTAETLQKLKAQDYALGNIWSSDDYYSVTDTLSVGHITRTDTGFLYAIELYDVPNIEPSVMREPLSSTQAVDNLLEFTNSLSVSNSVVMFGN